MNKRNLHSKRAFRFLLFIMLLSAAGMTNANPVDMRTAREVGYKFINANVTPMRGINDLQLVSTYNISRGEAAFHIFNTPNGFVIVSADDCATPILGYSDEGRFNTENIPIQLLDYLQGFVEQIQYGIENHLEADDKTAQQWEMVKTIGRLTDNRSNRSIGPLVTATWDQNYPYNNLCPYDSNGNHDHVYAGCVATAMAMIMHYWEYPAIGIGLHTYVPNGYSQQTAYYCETTYDWANMPDYYSNAWNSSQIDAVATLLWHCGVAVDMMYGSNESVAYSEDVPYALINYFGYSDELVIEYCGDNDSWISQVKDCLDLGRPLYYSGSDSNSGHAFVCDGYDANNNLHFNWGWSGNYNGYFSVGALNVSSHHFNYNNAAIFNIHPNCSSGSTYHISCSSSSPIGGIVSGSDNYECGEGCIVTATPAEGYMFCSWTENGNIVSTKPSYGFPVIENRNLEANFIENPDGQCTLVFNLYGSDYYDWEGAYLLVNYSNGCVPSEHLTIERGTSALFTRPVPNGSHIIIGWNTGFWGGDGCSFTISYDDSTVIYEGYNLNNNFSYEFDVNCLASPNDSYSITATSNDSDCGYVEGGGNYYYGQTCMLTATPYTGCSFCYWSENGQQVSTDACYSFLVTEDRDLVAHFVNEGNIVFADANVKALCVANWDTNGDGELSYAEAGAVTDLDTVFNSNSNITNFEELQYFIGLISISSNAFKDCSGLFSIVIPNSVTIINSNAFSNCSGLTSIEIPNSVTRINSNAFSNCSGLTSIEIPNSVTVINNGVFESCSSLISIEIPNSVTFIGRPQFSNCSSLEQIIVASGNTVYDSRDNCNAIIKTSTNELWLGCKNSIIPNSVTSITAAAFQDCSGLTSIEIPNSVTSIGHNAFKNCSGLTSIEIPNSVTTIGNSAFSSCSGLTSITVHTETPPSLYSNTFYNCPKSIPLYVPCGCLAAYQSAAYWKKFTNIIEMCPSEITATANPSEGGSVSGAGTYDFGTTITLTATANENYIFANWTENGEVVSTEADYTFTVTGGRTLVANFVELTNHYIPQGSAYSETMALYGVIQIDGVEQHSGLLEVGAFCGDECRGSAIASEFEITHRYLAILNIFGENGHQLTFKLYDHGLGEELELTSPAAITFDVDGYGNPIEPYVLNFTGEPSEVTQTITLSQGWNWFSTYIEAENPVAMLQLLEVALGENGLYIESSELLSTEYLDGEWIGDLEEVGITNEQMYLIQTSDGCTIQLHGALANPVNHVITFHPEWNWVGYPCSEEMTIAEALVGFVPEDGDQIESMEGYAEYLDGEWLGLSTLKPGQGFLYYSNSATTKTFTFPSSAK